MLLHPLSDRGRSDVARPQRRPMDGQPIDASESEEPPDTESKSGRKPRRRRLVLFIGAILCGLVLLFGIVVGVMLFLARDTSSPYPVGKALEQFKLLQRRDESLTNTASLGLPVTGVYMYTTTGSESANAPGLPSSGAQYPETTAMTVLADGCGEDWRWQPLTDRYEDLVVCRSSNGALVLQSRFDAVQFYRDNDRRNFPCACQRPCTCRRTHGQVRRSVVNAAMPATRTAEGWQSPTAGKSWATKLSRWAVRWCRQFMWR